jgi:hypothetical protein
LVTPSVFLLNERCRFAALHPAPLPCIARKPCKACNAGTRPVPQVIRRSGPKLAKWAALLKSEKADQFKEQEILPDFLTDFFLGLLGYSGPTEGGAGLVPGPDGLDCARRICTPSLTTCLWTRPGGQMDWIARAEFAPPSVTHRPPGACPRAGANGRAGRWSGST